jgi:DNA-binding FadR family transcriptional regulator
MSGDSPRRRPLQPPRLAELVAAALRERILSGELADGSVLPRQEDLMREFQVSMPSIREAIRILESEGVITVVRGNVGGAIVRGAPVGTAAYTLAMVLQARRVYLDDVALALGYLEPVCASFCAVRRDRRKSVVPVLRRIHAETVRARHDVDLVTASARRFHEAVVRECGNETLIVLVGALEEIWTSHAADVAALARRPGRLPEIDVLYRERALEEYADAHAAIIDAIASGDAEAAHVLSAAHLLVAARRSPMTHRLVRASVVRSERI